MRILIHVSLVHQLFQEHSSRDKGQPRLLRDVLVHPNLVPHKGPQMPAVSFCHEFGHALGSDSTWLGADDVAVLVGNSMFLQDELGHLSALPTSC